ncbi:hypothetical protein [Williamsia serinedens]|uniref:Lipoprotein n=1 Tax=Williamsia serinedens TaxID=391736 RepID=A0ABT1H527_9NOCA|nr:hypothetical protein [Williamsia serinedens]MCP2162351.1 hypothetical protein [Williamsia serinedens]
MRISYRKTVVAAAIAAVAILPAAACSSDDSSSGSSSTAASASAPESSAAQSTPAPVATVPALTGRDTAVALDTGFTDALTALKLTPGVVGGAKLENGSLIFPITGGNVTYYTPGSIQPYVQGIIDHKGAGFSLTGGGKTVDITNLTIDPGTSKLMADVSVDGQVAATQAIVFDLDGSTLKPLQTNPDGTAVLEGTRVLISDTAAGLLNQTFNTDAVKAGLLVGIAKITINTK